MAKAIIFEPWVAQYLAGGHHWIDTAPGGAGCKQVASLEFSDDMPDDDMQHAAVHLMAAAPEMLAALRIMVEQMESTSAWEDALNGEDEYLTNAVANAKAAIAKAEGSTP